MYSTRTRFTCHDRPPMCKNVRCVPAGTVMAELTKREVSAVLQLKSKCVISSRFVISLHRISFSLQHQFFFDGLSISDINDSTILAE